MKLVDTTLTYWHTLKYLRPIQFYGRLVRHVRRPRPKLGPAPPLLPIPGSWELPARRTASMVGPEEFLFLDVHGTLDSVGWTGVQRDKLWRYNQHYFDDLNAVGAQSRRDWHVALLNRWVRDNPPAGGDGWEPYPASLRIVNWLKWYLRGEHLVQPCAHSLFVQARWLSEHLEMHLLGNHLFANAKALVFVGLCFEGDEAGRMLTKGLALLAKQISEQVLPDGGHFELSTMYHALALEDLLDVCNLMEARLERLRLDRRQLLSEWRILAIRMHHWLQCMCHPDGEISFFNDAAFGIAPAPKELADYAARLGLVGQGPPEPVTWLASSGYVRIGRGPLVTLIDVAAVGPSYLPGHAHADTLSFELSVGRSRVLVNSGTSTYVAGPQRSRERGTAAHNTVVVDESDSSEVWSSFRVARRAKVRDISVSSSGSGTVVHAAHDGYARLRSGLMHVRTWEQRDRTLTVTDQLTLRGCEARARFHFHPDVDVKIVTDHRGEAWVDGKPCLIWDVVGGQMSLEDTSWHSGFGKTKGNKCLSVALKDDMSIVHFTSP